MGKIIGSIIGFFMFPPLGAILGLFLGAFYDTLAKDFTFESFGFDDFNRRMTPKRALLMKNFPVILAYLTGGSKINGILLSGIENRLHVMFDPQTAVNVMSKYRYYLQTGVAKVTVESACSEIGMIFNAEEKEQLIKVLSNILHEKTVLTKLDQERFAEIVIFLRTMSSFNYHYNYNYNTNNSNDYRRQRMSSVRPDYDPYSVLGISRTADISSIKKKYHELAKKYHPDLNSNLSESDKEKYDKKMREINNAYEKIKQMKK